MQDPKDSRHLSGVPGKDYGLGLERMGALGIGFIDQEAVRVGDDPGRPYDGSQRVEDGCRERIAQRSQRVSV
jgi:hypothetical protein